MELDATKILDKIWYTHAQQDRSNLIPEILISWKRKINKKNQVAVPILTVWSCLDQIV
uniref:Uncharacterized protein n=1 Tax=Rhizophora mucronata TaxID=61149 RepID=A0A2P2PFC3_RHIMU